MNILESHAVLITITLFILGTIAAFISSYIKFINEFNFIKGQISQLLEIHEGFTELVEKHAKMETDVHKVFKDIDKAFTRIKILENTFLNRGN